MAFLFTNVSRFLVCVYGLIVACLLLQGVAAGKDHDDDHRASGKAGYTHGQSMPVTCLNRTIDSGEHITDNLGKLQFVPFPTCNETSLPLALQYGVTETVNCTVDSLPDELYHLLEYYIHSDVPMTCRVPTAPLAPGSEKEPEHKDQEKGADALALDSGDPSYTPLTFALQGTLQRSHLHIWTDMNMLVHNIASGASSSTKKKKKGKSQYASPGYVVAGTAYSLPEFENASLQKSTASSSSREKEEKAVAAMSEAARDPWTAGHGTKVIRGEPLTFTFHVSWIEGGRGIGWPFGSSSLSLSSPSSLSDEGKGSSGAGSFFSRLFFFILASSVGALVALYWERNRRTRWRGDGILGAPPSGARGKGAAGVMFGNGGRANGYGGFSSAGATSSPGTGNGGYGGFTTGKRD